MRNRIRNILIEATAFNDRPNINDNFWKWFGDSKMVDVDGNPHIFYHGTTADFSEFNTRPASFFTFRIEYASKYGKKQGGSVVPVYLSLQNPARMSDLRMVSAEVKKENPELKYFSIDQYAEELGRRGFDGLISMGYPQQPVEVLVFDSTKIKSIYNQGTWNPNSKDITK